MKYIDNVININKGNNFIISHSDSDWNYLREGMSINIGNDAIFYTIGNKEKINFIQEFKKETKGISIDGNWEYLFLIGDSINLSYKEYELLTIKNIINKGENYKDGDLLSLNGGSLSINIFDNTSNSTLLKVESVNGNGGIEKLSVIHRGKYICFPNTSNSILGGHGQNAIIDIESKIIESRTIVERTILSIKNIDYKTIIELSYPIPENIQEGKISVTKWKAYLSNNYIGETQKNVSCNIIRDSTPYLELPLLLKNSNKTEEIFNHSIKKIDSEIKLLKDQLEELRKLVKK